MKTATDVGLQTWEADVTCGVWCQGGSVRWLKTDHPQYTDASDVWVRGDDAIAALESLRAELAKADGQINRCVDQNKYLERLLAEAQRDVSIVTFLRCGGWEVLQNPKYWTPENKFFGAIAEAMADVAMEGK